MWNPFKSKTIEMIEAEARKKERKICEDHFLEELNIQRERFSESAKERDKLHAQELKTVKDEENKKRTEEVHRVTQKYVNHLRKLKNTIAEKDLKIEETRNAWEMFKEFMPDAIRLSNILKIRSQIDMDNSVEKFRDSAALEDNFESLGRKIRGITPHIEGLLAEPEEKKK
jgi:hypothetical protein